MRPRTINAEDAGPAEGPASLRALRTLRSSYVVLALLASTSAVRAEVTRVEIVRRGDLGASGYEKIVGTIHFALDPKDPHNRLVVDLDKAPVNASGRVEFSSDLYILRPKAPRGNGAALVDILNRGNKVVLNGFNRGGPPDPATENDLGDRFLMRFGYTLVWVGWEFDVPERPFAMRIHVPVATDQGKPIAGVVRAAWTATAAAKEFVVNDLAMYDAIDADGADSVLMVCTTMHANICSALGRESWRLKGHTVTLDTGFVPGTTYHVRYRAANPPVAGLGFAAIRDTVTWLKRRPDALAPVQFAYGYGSSQSGRFLRSFLNEGFNTDEQDRQVFDAVFAHIAGASRLNLNTRWATPTSLGAYDATWYPFDDAGVASPQSRGYDRRLESLRARHAPKVFYTNTPVEYWGLGRAAALVHASPEGDADLALPENVRLYFIAGTQHSPSRFPPAVTNGQQIDNAVDYWWTMRALLMAMHKWVKQGIAPPASLYPRLQDGTLVPAASVAFPSIPGVTPLPGIARVMIAPNPRVPRGANADQEPRTLPLLVPAVDQDGNERAGIRLPEIAVPLATYTGWNLRKPEIGAPNELAALLGSTIPFPATRADREKTGDPRQSIEERYESRDEYLARVEQVLDALVLKGYLIYDDGPRILQRAGDQWDLAFER